MGVDFCLPWVCMVAYVESPESQQAHIPRTALSSIYILFEFHSGFDRIPSLWTWIVPRVRNKHWDSLVRLTLCCVI